MNTPSVFKRTYLIFSFAFMIYQGFIITFLNTLGFSESEIGFILSINLIGAVIGQFVNGYVADKWLSLRQVMLIQIALSIVGMSILFFSTDYIAFAIVAVIIGFSLYSLYSVIDSWVLFESKETSEQYPLILMFSSIGKSISSLLMGKVLELFGYDYMPIFYVISAFIFLYTVYKMQNSTKDAHEDREPVTGKDVLKMLNIKFIANVLLVSFLVFGMYSIFVNSNILIKTYGGTVFHVGVYFTIAGISELFYYYIINKYMSKMHPYVFMLMSIILILVNILIILFTESYVVLLLSGFIYSGIFANFIMGSKRIFVLIVDEKVKNMGQSVSAALYFSLAGAITTSVTGVVSENIGIIPMFRYILGIEILILFILTFINLRQQVTKSI